ncbi:MAG TPA: hypothetical protein VEM96_04385 [Pyrinomonadaceae bacterium]|nr:hypothetical protein [Pyrinomonadaceae bacterium]
MKTRTGVHAKLIWLSSFFVLATPFLLAVAQSGRGLSIPPSTPSPTPPVQSQRQMDTRPNFAVGSDKYKLVFLEVYEIKRTLAGGKEIVDTDATRRSQLTNFNQQLNKAGAQGYKLTSSIYGWMRSTANYHSFRVSLLYLDEVQYEYDWFETTSNLYFAMGDFDQAYTKMSGRGFRLADYFLTSLACDDTNSDGYLPGICESEYLFLVEREKNVERPKPFVVARSTRGWRERMGEALTTQINSRQAAGFYPMKLFSKFEVLLEETNDELSGVKRDMQVLTSSFGNGVKKKVNELGKQGYRLALINNEAALMYRSDEMLTPLTYVWLKAKDKSFAKQLAKLQESGAVYRMTYRDGDAVQDQLVFEQGAAESRRREYQVLSFEFQVVENTEGKVQFDLTPSSKKLMKTFNSLVKDGFAARDLFVPDRVSDKVSVILERIQ